MGSGMDDQESKLEWVMMAETVAAMYVHRLAEALVRGDLNLPIDPSAWRNTMAAAEWAIGEHLAGRVQRSHHARVTGDDVEALRQLHALGTRALVSGEWSPAFADLAERCMVLLEGENWRETLPVSAEYVRLCLPDL
jgi:hypothetical protein